MYFFNMLKEYFRKLVPVVILCFLSMSIYSQTPMREKRISFIPQSNVKIKGLAIGPFQFSHNEEDKLEISGVGLELVGLGLFVPLVGSHPLRPYYEDRKDYNIALGSLIKDAKTDINVLVKGVSLSLSGTAGGGHRIQGVNISGLNTLTSYSSGVAIAPMFCLHKVMHGVSVGAINDAVEHKGLQIGLFNNSDRTRGFQIGLWNKNEKRSLPFINWNFSK